MSFHFSSSLFPFTYLKAGKPKPNRFDLPCTTIGGVGTAARIPLYDHPDSCRHSWSLPELGVTPGIIGGPPIPEIDFRFSALSIAIRGLKLP
jgi:hypothetical protein